MGLNGCCGGIVNGSPRLSACHLKNRYTKRRLVGISAGPLFPQWFSRAEKTTGFILTVKCRGKSRKRFSWRYENGEMKSKYQVTSVITETHLSSSGPI